MKLKHSFIFSYYVLILFIFVYTLNINLNIEQNINIFNMIFMFIFFIAWLFSWYLFFVKDIFKSDQRERNGLSLILVLLAILMFFYNPIPSPDIYYIFINREYFFIFTIITLLSFIVVSFKKKFFIFGLFVIIPILVQSFIINILNNYSFYNDYPYTTTIVILFLSTLYYAYSIIKNNL